MSKNKAWLKYYAKYNLQGGRKTCVTIYAIYAISITTPDQIIFTEPTSSTDELIKGGFELMRCGKSHPSCPQIRAQRHPDSDLPDSRLTQLSSIFVDIGSQYGTRMQTGVITTKVDFFLTV